MKHGRQRSRRYLSVLGAGALLAGGLMSVALTAGASAATVSPAAAKPAVAKPAVAKPAVATPDAVPAPPSGWSTVFSDDFNGAANTAPSASNWFYDIGSGYGTGEIENTTNSTSNVYQDGNGDLVLKAIDSGGTWTSGRIESTRDDFAAPAGGELEMTASIEQPDPATP